jgi:hypothetical protein
MGSAIWPYRAQALAVDSDDIKRISVHRDRSIQPKIQSQIAIAQLLAAFQVTSIHR